MSCGVCSHSFDPCLHDLTIKQPKLRMNRKPEWLIHQKTEPGGATLTDIGECLYTTLDVGFLRRDDPVAVVESEGGLQQLDEDGLVCL